MRKDTQWHRGRVVSAADACPGVREIMLDPGTAARHFEVGSHVNFRVQLHGRDDVRSYSLVGEPRADGYFRIAVRQMPDSRGGSLHMWTLAPGDVVEMSPPNNNFPLDESGEEILLIAGGIGITPIIGMAQRLARRHPAFRLLYAGRSRSATAYVDTLEALLGKRLQLQLRRQRRPARFGCATGAALAQCRSLRMRTTRHARSGTPALARGRSAVRAAALRNLRQ
ncbi:phenoxybenzoate dioxygenase [Xanthomonas vasicola pv. musacearum NCPPB 2005]|nr:phenoxybenzoate dioxygenase [Xanthomonas vasicola pv. musacearum NCPPB 2005]KFA07724.1 phenoxybenzoate dioxygenase [Xanthomonas vasicola pv. musacearum NCPPB 4380]KFA18923.1 phenoxybenzoate dioxygenase [Xanthomonas vasicola pv. musacearum NCPPB 4392]KFA20393.1 phenoxybenzoate dioxygenase [Xanthomonas vasicola pv. musacearum NCPPB 4394]KFA36571.1 phenoxybenzoate dioxygenase [Xanthomonas vasicola pv. vasculorum NCPPB 206]KFA38778.1 phenoxybenzoate dioxygenase [Xanthomonas vasicola pv. musacea